MVSKGNTKNKWKGIEGGCKYYREEKEVHGKVINVKVFEPAGIEYYNAREKKSKGRKKKITF